MSSNRVHCLIPWMCWVTLACLCPASAQEASQRATASDPCTEIVRSLATQRGLDGTRLGQGIRAAAGAWVENPSDEATARLLAAILDPTGGLNTEGLWLAPPGFGGKGNDEVFVIRSMTIQGLDKANIDAEPLSKELIEIDPRPAAWGRPIGATVTIGDLLHPVSPLCLYRSEVDRITAQVLAFVQKAGIIGVFVSCAEPVHSPDGRLVINVMMARVSEVRFEDRRPAGSKPVADAEKIMRDCPWKAGHLLRKPEFDEFMLRLGERYSCDANCAISPDDKDQNGEGVIITLVLQPSEK